MKRVLTHSQALDALHQYFRFVPVHDISGSMMVNIWRVYDILNGDTHQPARAEFLKWAKENDHTLYTHLSKTTKWRRDHTQGSEDPTLFDLA